MSHVTLTDYLSFAKFPPMGTNFYLETEAGDVVHLGKRSGGWKFTLNGNADTGPGFETFADVVRFLETTPGILTNDNNADERDPVTFCTMVRSLQDVKPCGRPRRDPVDCLNSGHGRAWHDDQGFCFRDAEFC